MTASINKTDLYGLHGIVQNTLTSYPKDLLIEVLRDEFSKDSQYHYQADQWGFPKVNDHTGQPLEAGRHDDATTRIFIGQAYPYNRAKHYPSILIRGGSFKSTPLSFSRNEGVIKHKVTRVVDGYGNEKIYSTPSYFELAGAWEGNLTVEISAGDMQARDDLVGIISSIITITNYKMLYVSGVIFKPISGSSPTETDDAGRKIYKQTISCDIRTEWRQQIPIDSLVDAINFCIDFGDVSQGPEKIAPNLEIKSTVELIDAINAL